MTFLKYLSLVVLTGLMLVQAGPLHGQTPFNQLIVFGDSESDTGNVFASSGASPGGPFPLAPLYFNGRFSNGPVYSEFVASYLGMPALVPSVTGGTNYAFGAAQTGSGNSLIGLPNMGPQLSQYLATNPTPTAQQLFLLYGGANDMVFAGVTDPNIPVNNLASSITALAAIGAKSFLVPNMFPLGDIPQVSSTAQAGPLNARTIQFNALLAAKLDMLEATLGIKILRMDTYGLIQNIKSNPAGYGLTNLTQPALINGGLGFSNSPVVANPNEYLFWDNIHYTTGIHQAMGNLAIQSIQSIPEPGTWALIGLSLVGAGSFVVLRRHRFRRAADQMIA